MAEPRVEDGPGPRRLHGRANDGAATRRLILTTAARLFSEQGYSSTSLNDITTATGMTKGALYWHFSSKEEIALSIVRETYGRWPRILAEVTAAHDDALAAIEAVMKRVAHEFMNNFGVQATRRLLADLPTSALAELPRPYLQWELLVTRLLSEGKEKGQISPEVAAEGAARVLVASFFGMQQVSYEVSRREDLPMRIQEFWSLVRPALAPSD